MEFFYKKEIDLGKENNFTIDLSKSNTVEGQKITKDIDLVEENNFTINLSKRNTVEGQKITKDGEYVICDLELNLPEVDFTLWQGFDKKKSIRQDKSNEGKKTKFLYPWGK